MVKLQTANSILFLKSLYMIWASYIIISAYEVFHWDKWTLRLISKVKYTVWNKITSLNMFRYFVGNSSHKPVSLLVKCHVIKIPVWWTHYTRGRLYDRLVICWVGGFFLTDFTASNRSWLRSSEPFWLERGLFWWIHYVHEPNRQTHPHSWRDAPGAGLAVTEPEGAVVPGNRRVELQLMPLFLEGRRMRKDFHWPYSQLVLLSGGCTCLLSCLMPHRWQTQHSGRGHFKKFHFLLRIYDQRRFMKLFQLDFVWMVKVITFIKIYHFPKF